VSRSNRSGSSCPQPRPGPAGPGCSWADQSCLQPTKPNAAPLKPQRRAESGSVIQDCKARPAHDPEKCEAVFRKDHAQTKSSSEMTIRKRVIPLWAGRRSQWTDKPNKNGARKGAILFHRNVRRSAKDVAEIGAAIHRQHDHL